ncbi:MAG TPA: tRNA (guanosine(37)-N1)-methyltransferase TrmD [Patescibacteria group bacterium]|nr:tRNA (guanosine(37)-N1)-methyltransferase TrmD [Patescibacteria group bacterium]
MNFHIVTIFPNIFESYFDESIISRARKKGAIGIKIHNLRDFTTDKHKTVDDTPYGGGAGMVMKVEPIYKCVQDIISNSPNCLISNKISKSKIQISSKCQILNSNKENTRIILFSAKGKRYAQTDAKRLAQYDNLILICGRYEGVDERVAQNLADEEISIGDYVLTGGEIPAMVVVDSITRLLPGVLGNSESAVTESHSAEGYLEYPQYTKPENYNDWKVPEILLSGNHEEIMKWHIKNAKIQISNDNSNPKSE